MREEKLSVLNLRCQCNRNIFNAKTYARARYKRHDRILQSFGATRRPHIVEIRCAVCGFCFGISHDPELCERACATDTINLSDIEKISQIH